MPHHIYPWMKAMGCCWIWFCFVLHTLSKLRPSWKGVCKWISPIYLSRYLLPLSLSIGTLEMGIGPWFILGIGRTLDCLSRAVGRSRINPVAVFVVYQYCICPPCPVFGFDWWTETGLVYNVLRRRHTKHAAVSNLHFYNCIICNEWTKILLFHKMMASDVTWIAFLDQCLSAWGQSN